MQSFSWPVVLLVAAAATFGCGRQEAGSDTDTHAAAEPDLNDKADESSQSELGGPTVKDSASDSQPPDYFPLTSPKKLEYDVTYKVTVLGGGEGRAVTQVDDREIDGRRYVAYKTKLTGTPWDDTWERLFRRTAAGVMVRNVGAKEDELFLPQRPAVGDEWTAKFGDGTLDFRVAAIEDARCGGTLYRNCLKLSLTPQTGGAAEHRWFAPNVGIVKVEKQGEHFSTTLILTSLERPSS